MSSQSISEWHFFSPTPQPPFPALLVIYFYSMSSQKYIQYEMFKKKKKGQTPGNLWNVGGALSPQSYIKKFNYHKITVQQIYQTLSMYTVYIH